MIDWPTHLHYLMKYKWVYHQLFESLLNWHRILALTIGNQINIEESLYHLILEVGSLGFA